jgi:hypothetical protein
VNVLVVGTTEPVLQRLRRLAARVSPSLDVFGERGPVVADWVLTTTAEQRVAAIASHRLPPYRVIELPALASEPDLARSEDVVLAGLAKIASVGAPGPHLSPAGVSITRVVLRWISGAIERSAAEEFEFSDDAPWPPSATRWTTGEGAELKGRVLDRIPVGKELDDILAHQARKRAKRFAALAPPRGDQAPSGADRA